MSEEVKRVDAYLDQHDEDQYGDIIDYMVYYASKDRPMETINLSKKDIREIIEKNKRLMNALDPEKTKGKYIGEFKFPVTTWEEDESGIMQEQSRDVTVPWSTIKEIMDAIKRQAGEDQ